MSATGQRRAIEKRERESLVLFELGWQEGQSQERQTATGQGREQWEKHENVPDTRYKSKHT